MIREINQDDPGSGESRAKGFGPWRKRARRLDWEYWCEIWYCWDVMSRI